MITHSIPNNDQLFIRVKSPQLLDKSDGVFSIAALVGRDGNLLISQIHNAIIGLSLFRIDDGNFRPLIALTPDETDRVAPDQVTLIFSKNNDFA